MHKIIILFKKELSFYLNNPVGYIAVILFAVFANFLFIKDLFLRGDSSMRPFFDVLPWLFLIFLPAVAMRSLADEHNTNTIELLLSWPVSETQVVIAKWAALCALVMLSLTLTLSIPITLAMISTIPIGEIVVNYLGAIFFAASSLSLCLFFSAQTKNQVIAFLSSIIVLFALFVIGGSFFESIIPKILYENMTILSPMYHYETFLKGLIDIRAVTYFISFTVLFLFLTTISLEKRT